MRIGTLRKSVRLFYIMVGNRLFSIILLTLSVNNKYWKLTNNIYGINYYHIPLYDRKIKII